MLKTRLKLPTLIPSVSKPFCSTCTRARLTIEGKLVTCLFAVDGTDLRTPLRSGSSDAKLRKQIAGIWKQRTDRYSDLRTEIAAARPDATRSKIEMYQIGG